MFLRFRIWAPMRFHDFNQDENMQADISWLRKIGSAGALTLAWPGVMAAVPPSDPPTNYFGPTTFASAVATNVRFASGTGTIVSGAALDGYFWGTGDSTTQWTGGTIATYLQADGSAAITVIGSGLTLLDLGPYFSGEKYHVSGMLLSGESVSIDAYTYSSGSIVVRNVPEPATYAMWLFGLVPIFLRLIRTTGAKSH